MAKINIAEQRKGFERLPDKAKIFFMLYSAESLALAEFTIRNPPLESSRKLSKFKAKWHALGFSNFYTELIEIKAWLI